MKITAIALLSTVVAIPAFAQTGAVGAGDRSPAAAYAAAGPAGHGRCKGDRNSRMQRQGESLYGVHLGQPGV